MLKPLIDGLGRATWSLTMPVTLSRTPSLQLLVSLISCVVACSARIETDRQTHRPSTVTLAAHARRGLMKCKPSAPCQGRAVYLHLDQPEDHPGHGPPLTRYILVDRASPRVLELLISHFMVCSARISIDRHTQTHRPSIVL